MPESFEGKGSSFFQPRELLPFLLLTMVINFGCFRVWEWSPKYVIILFTPFKSVPRLFFKCALLILRVRTRLENPWKPLNFKRPFSRLAWKSLKFSFVRFGPFESPWSLIEEHLIRSIVTIFVLFITEGYSLISAHAQTSFHKKWLPLGKKAHYYQNIFVLYVQPV